MLFNFLAEGGQRETKRNASGCAGRCVSAHIERKLFASADFCDTLQWSYPGGASQGAPHITAIITLEPWEENAMKKIAFLLVLILCVPLAAQAQRRKFEAFLGYSLQHVEGMPSNANLNGWEGSLTYKLTPFLGITGDTTANYGTLTNSSINFHSYLAGVQASLPRRFTPFVHVLAGISRSSVFGNVSHTFSMAIGGGVDYRATHFISIRLIQADELTGATKQTSSDVRISTGIVLRF